MKGALVFFNAPEHRPQLAGPAALGPVAVDRAQVDAEYRGAFDPDFQKGPPELGKIVPFLMPDGYPADKPERVILLGSPLGQSGLRSDLLDNFRVCRLLQNNEV